MLTAKVVARSKTKFAGAFLLLAGITLFLIFSQRSLIYRNTHDDGAEIRILDDLSGKLPLIVPPSFPKKELKSFINDLLREIPGHKDDYNVYSMQRPKVYPEMTLLVDDVSSIFTNFREEKTPIFGSFEDIKGQTDECRQLESELSYLVSNEKELSTSAVKIAKNIVKALDSDDEYVKLIGKYFLKKVKLQLKHNVADKFWYKLAGSSVWLKDYGVHLMVSRIIYSEKNARNHPTFSIAYAQLFTDDWVEVHTSLLVPTNLGPAINKNAIEVDNDPYTVMSFPMILPIPFIMDTKKELQGPEDPRIILVKNKRGHEEPLIIFNQNHQKKSIEVSDGKEIEESKDYRNMWISLLWQYQVGKYNVDDEDKAEYSRKLFSKTSELQIKGAPRELLVKNWTPMISKSLRDYNGYDKSLLIISRFANLEVLKCDLMSDEALCEYMSMDDNKPPETSVGPLRGGTGMVNINNLIQEQTDFPVERLIKKGREIWVGLARAHFRDCGCGRAFYRPNIVVVTLDLITGEDNKVRQVFSLSHTSSFLDLNIDIIPWSDEEPNLCQGPNVLIPNGISYWKIGKIEKNPERDEWLVDDILTLSFSVSDNSVSVLKIKGLLESIMKTSPHSPFENYEDYPNDFSFGDGDNEDKEFVPSRTMEFGGTEDAIMCALEDSERFCRAYAEKHPFDKREWEKTLKKHPPAKKVNSDLEAYFQEADGKN